MAPDPKRLSLHSKLEAVAGVQKVYFQPPQNISLVYPCIIYTRSDSSITSADNVDYLHKKRYDVLVIVNDPDSRIPDDVEKLPLCRFDRFYAVDNLNHYTFSLYF